MNSEQLAKRFEKGMCNARKAWREQGIAAAIKEVA